MIVAVDSFVAVIDYLLFVGYFGCAGYLFVFVCINGSDLVLFGQFALLAFRREFVGFNVYLVWLV